MELKKHLDWRYIFVGLYVLLFAIYLVVGLQPAQASDYEKAGELTIPSIGLDSEVVKVGLKDYKVETPDDTIGSYAGAEHKTLLVGHSTGVFANLNQVKLKDEIVYGGEVYAVRKIEFIAKEKIRMRGLLKREDEDTLVMMTCAGELLGEGEATHRLIITATRKD